MRLTRRSLVLAAAAAATLVPASTAVAHDDHGSHHRTRLLLLAPIAGSLTTDPPIFGVAPGGAPWVIDRGHALVRTNGRVDVRVEGLVIPTPPANGTNPVPRLSASVTCNGKVAGTTKTVRFSREGNARIHDRISIPKRCIAPVVMLNPNGNKAVYIGITGTEE